VGANEHKHYVPDNYASATEKQNLLILILKCGRRLEELRSRRRGDGGDITTTKGSTFKVVEGHPFSREPYVKGGSLSEWSQGLKRVGK